ncbi:hypothetical protein GCM10009751_21700 [Myceligenerans crystallogenes]|uniref:YhcG N-terminal domain-containing protein n=2 Tax=Myceligenerans crystallogenes TaxID=316335 RepID=A0ABP4ZLZ7_9MICO
MPVRHVRRRAGRDGSPVPAGYDEFCADLRTRVQETRERAARQVNAEMIRLYWQAGRDVLVRKREHGWSPRETERVAARVRRELEPLERLARQLVEDLTTAALPVDSTRVAEVIHELRAIQATFDGATADTTPDGLRLSGFHAYDHCVRELLDALEPPTKDHDAQGP